MISIPDLIDLVKTAVPDAEVNVLDKTGMSDHFIIHVTSVAFEELGIMDRHRKVQDALNPAMKDGRIHAAEIKTATPWGLGGYKFRLLKFSKNKGANNVRARRSN